MQTHSGRSVWTPVLPTTRPFHLERQKKKAGGPVPRSFLVKCQGMWGHGWAPLLELVLWGFHGRLYPSGCRQKLNINLSSWERRERKSRGAWARPEWLIHSDHLWFLVEADLLRFGSNEWPGARPEPKHSQSLHPWLGQLQSQGGCYFQGHKTLSLCVLPRSVSGDFQSRYRIWLCTGLGQPGQFGGPIGTIVNSSIKQTS